MTWPTFARLAVCLLLSVAAPALAAGVGKVDGQRILAAFEPYQAHHREVEERRDQMARLLQERSDRFGLLRDAEWNELQTLRGRAEPLTAAQRERLQVLRRLTDLRDLRLAALETKADPTVAERTELTELQTIRREAADAIQSMYQRLSAELAQLDARGMARLQARIDEAIAKVAAEQSLAMVVKAEDVLYGGTDITEAVIAALNAKPAED